MRYDYMNLSVWVLAAVSLASGANVTSPLLDHLKGKLDAELRATGIHTERFDGHDLLKLQADAAAMRERFGHHYATDFLGDTSLELKINSPYPAWSSHPCRRVPNRKRIIGDHFTWAKCEAIKSRRGSFLQCSLLDAEVTPMKEVLALMRISVEQTRYGELEEIGRDWWVPDVETNVSSHHESFFLIRPISVSSEWRYLICSGDYTFCQVRVHLHHVASLDAFETQLDFISGLMEDIEQEVRRLLDLPSPLETANATCAKSTTAGANATSNVKGGSTKTIENVYIVYAELTFAFILCILLVVILYLLYK